MIRAAVLILLALLGLGIAAFAQNSAEDDKSYFLTYVENKLSTDNRRISISGISGALSSNAAIDRITIADRKGVWLTLSGAKIVWTRSALLKGTLEIDELVADRIDMVRRPLPDKSLPNPETKPFALPDLPVGVKIGKLSVGVAKFAPEVFGTAAELSLDGSVQLADGSLDTALQINRLDGPGGKLGLNASYANATRSLAIDLAADEPANGVLANLLNIENRPPLALTVKGEGPLDRFRADLALDADARRVLSGIVQLGRQGDDLGFSADLNGTVAALVPEAFRGFFGRENRLQLEGSAPAEGGVAITSLSVTGGALTLQGNAWILADGFLRQLVLDASIAAPGGEAIILPVAGGDTTLASAELHVAYGTAETGRWSGALVARDVKTAEFGIGNIKVDLGGNAENLDDPAARATTFGADVRAEGVIADDPAVAEALGERIAATLGGRYQAAQPIRIFEFQLAGAALRVAAEGAIEGSAFTGAIKLETASLAPFSGLAGRPLSGAATIKADGSIAFLSGGFDLLLDGSADGITTGDPQTDRLFAGTTQISGRLARNEEGVRARNFRLGNAQAEMTADGGFSSEKADFRLDARVADLNLLDTRLSGPLTANGTLDGENGVIAAKLAIAVPAGKLMNLTLRDGVLKIDGTIDKTGFAGLVDGSLFLDGERTALSANVGYNDGTLALSGLSLKTRGAALSGDFTRDANGFLAGTLALDARDISMLAALMLQEASGSATAQVALAHANDRQSARVDATLGRLRLSSAGFSINELDLRAEIADLFGVPATDATFSARALEAAGIKASTVDGTAKAEGGVTAFAAKAVLDREARAELSGKLEPVADGYLLAIDHATLLRGKRGLVLKKPTSVKVAGGAVEIAPSSLSVGEGSIDLGGTVADRLALELMLNRVPLDIANLVRPDLAAAGTFGGVVTLAGTRDRPRADLLLRGQGITVSALGQAGIAPVSLDLKGNTVGDRLTLDLGATNSQGMNARATGNVSLGKGALDLDVTLASFPLAALNAARPGTGLGGRLAGTAKVGGTVAAPEVTFAIDGNGVTAAQLSQNGIPPLAIAARGSFSRRTIRLQLARATGAGGLDLTADGVIPLAGSGLAIAFNGTAPLSLADRFLADRGARANGLVRISGRAAGVTSNPRLTASLSATGAAFTDPLSSTRLQAIAFNAAVNDDSVTIRTFDARLATGGSLSASGTVALDDRLSANLAATLDNARYSDGELVAATLSGKMTVTGSLLRDPLIAGDIFVERAELTVPEQIAVANDVADVEHVNAPATVRRTLARALPEKGAPIPRSRPSVPQLDIRINAPARIFLRGRGLDTELGGSVVLRGPVTNVSPSGGFEIIRGRLSILGQRITLDSGRVTLIGDLDPYVDFTATTPGTDIDVTIKVTGRISDLSITFSSQPELPQDEVLSRLIFGQGISTLSPLQLAKLAAAASELAGGGPSIMDGVREATGLDDLDIVTDDQGNTAARAGRYITDNAYLGVQAGTKGKAKVTIDLDITDNLKARGAVSEDENSLGVFFEKDY